MNAIVSIVETRPETVGQDYVRALSLVGSGSAAGRRDPILIPRWEDGGFRPGFTSPPWQLAAVAEAWTIEDNRQQGLKVFPVDTRGPVPGDQAFGKSPFPSVFEEFGLELVEAPDRSLQPVRPVHPMPALGASLPAGFGSPAFLAGKPVVILAVPRLEARWRVNGSVALLTDLLAGRRRRPKRIPFSEVVAESLALAREQFGPMTVVLDGVAWGIRREDGRPHPLLRNIILAGNDPVAVDAVAARLAGQDPRRIPWLQLCQDRRLGAADSGKIDIRGRKDLLDLDFQVPEGTFTSFRPAGSILSWPGRMLGRLGRSDRDDTFATSAWGRLLAAQKEPHPGVKP